MSTITHTNTRLQGAEGLGRAIAYFTSCDYPIALTLTDSQRYDLIVDINKTLYRIEVKTTHYLTPHHVYSVSLTTSGGNQSWGGTKRCLSSADADFVFIVSADEHMYLLPIRTLFNKKTWNLGAKATPYSVTWGDKFVETLLKGCPQPTT